jgi:hypothetical protein
MPWDCLRWVANCCRSCCVFDRSENRSLSHTHTNARKKYTRLLLIDPSLSLSISLFRTTNPLSTTTKLPTFSRVHRAPASSWGIVKSGESIKRDSFGNAMPPRWAAMQTKPRKSCSVACWNNRHGTTGVQVTVREQPAAAAKRAVESESIWSPWPPTTPWSSRGSASKRGSRHRCRKGHRHHRYRRRLRQLLPCHRRSTGRPSSWTIPHRRPPRGGGDSNEWDGPGASSEGGHSSRPGRRCRPSVEIAATKKERWHFDWYGAL